MVGRYKKHLEEISEMLGIGRFVKKKLGLGRKNLKVESMLKKCLARMENIDSRLTETEGRQREMLTQINLNLKEYHQGNFFNQIALACPKDGRVLLHMPWNDPDCNAINLERRPSGQLCFPAPGLSDKKPVFVVTIPKSGSHLLLHTLIHLGFTSDNPKGHKVTSQPPDDHGVPEKVYRKIPPPLKERLMRARGTISVTHVTGDEGSIYVYRNKKILLAIRDLRYVAVSTCRWRINQGLFAMPDQKNGFFPANSELSSSLMLDFFKENHFQGILASARTYTKARREPFIRLVRFEEMVSSDREVMRPSAEAIAEVAECSLEEVFQALEKTSGKKTATYSGQLSRLGDFWTQEVEDRFIELGGDVLNERLGYNRHYTPKS